MPVLSAATIEPTRTITARDENGASRETAIPGEHPLTVYLNKRELVTLMTLGSAPEHLVLGYLRNQRIVPQLSAVQSVQIDWSTEAAAVVAEVSDEEIEQRTAHRIVTTGCGQGTVYGTVLDSLNAKIRGRGPRMDPPLVYEVVDAIRTFPSLYKRAGSVHGCALFRVSRSPIELLYFVEDVGRHNAVDSISGWMWLTQPPVDDLVMYTTGRLTSEMVIKASEMGISTLLSRSGVTEMGLNIAKRVGMTLLGRCTGRHFLVFTDEGRVECAAESQS